MDDFRTYYDVAEPEVHLLRRHAGHTTYDWLEPHGIPPRRKSPSPKPETTCRLCHARRGPGNLSLPATATRRASPRVCQRGRLAGARPGFSRPCHPCLYEHSGRTRGKTRRPERGFGTNRNARSSPRFNAAAFCPVAHRGARSLRSKAASKGATLTQIRLDTKTFKAMRGFTEGRRQDPWAFSRRRRRLTRTPTNPCSVQPRGTATWTRRPGSKGADRLNIHRRAPRRHGELDAASGQTGPLPVPGRHGRARWADVAGARIHGDGSVVGGDESNAVAVASSRPNSVWKQKKGLHAPGRFRLVRGVPPADQLSRRMRSVNASTSRSGSHCQRSAVESPRSSSNRWRKRTVPKGQAPGPGHAGHRR